MFLVDTGGLFARLDAFDVFASARIERIVNKFPRDNHAFRFFWMTFMEEPGAKNAMAQAHACFEVESFWICNQSCEIFGVFPFAICAAVAGRDQIIRDLIFEKVGLSAVPHRPIVPLA